MPSVDAGSVRSAINVTPLVDVVLVLLIIFMVIAPQMVAGPTVPVPETDHPREAQDRERRIVVAIAPGGGYWVDEAKIDRDRFAAHLEERAAAEPDGKVVIQADARLSFGEVKGAMLAAEAAGFRGVGLVAKRHDVGEE